MKKENKFILIISIIAIITLIGVVFFAIKYPVYKANKDAEQIEIGDNTDIDETPMENIEQDIIHYKDYCESIKKLGEVIKREAEALEEEITSFINCSALSLASNLLFASSINLLNPSCCIILFVF